MPFFDATPENPPGTKSAARPDQPDSPRRWLAWLSIPVPILLTMAAASSRQEGSDIFAFIGVIAGWSCIAFSQPQQRCLKWILFALYPFVMVPIVGVIAFAMSGHMRLF